MESILALVALICLKTVYSQPSSSCDICLDGVCYGSTQLINRSRIKPGTQIALDRVENILYYVHHNDIDSYNLQNRTTRTVVSNINATGLAVDENTRDLYISSGHDIIRYNPITNQTENFHERLRFHKLYFIKNSLYGVSISDLAPHRLFVLRELGMERFEPLKDKAFDCAVVTDKLGDIYFQRILETYKLPAGGNSTVLVANSPCETVVDKDGIAHFIDKLKNLIYRKDYITNELVKVGVVNGSFYLFWENSEFYFDKNNNIIHYFHNVEYFTPNEGRCTVREERYLDFAVWLIEKLN